MKSAPRRTIEKKTSFFTLQTVTAEPVSCRIQTASVGCSSISAIVHTPKSLSVPGHSSCNMASHCATGVDAVAAICLAICAYVVSSCAGVSGSGDTGIEDTLSA